MSQAPNFYIFLVEMVAVSVPRPPPQHLRAHCFLEPLGAVEGPAGALSDGESSGFLLGFQGSFLI